MRKTILTAWIICLIACIGYAQPLIDSTQLRIDEIERSLNYQKGVINLQSGNAVLTVPDGFKYLDEKQSYYVLTDLWGNPADSSILGLLVPENKGVLDSDSWVFTISYDEMGYVKDDDAEDIDYDDLLKDQQKEIQEANPERVKQGYEPIEFIGWASTPTYDKEKKVLHWAKELKFGDSNIHTLNYNLRILGRKGIFLLNAVANMREMPQVKLNIDKVIGCVEFNKGHQYADYIPDVDNVAAWTIGGLVAGKVLAKAGFFVFLVKFWKVIMLGFLGVSGGIGKYFKSRKLKAQIKELTKE